MNSDSPWSISPLVVSVQSLTQSCPTLCYPTDCSTPGLLVLHYLPELAQTHVYWISDAIQASHPLLSPSLAFSLSQHQRLFQWKYPGLSKEKTASSGQSIDFSFSISPSNEYSGLMSFRTDWFDLESKGLSRVFSNTTVQKHQFFGAQPSFWSNSHINT